MTNSTLISEATPEQLALARRIVADLCPSFPGERAMLSLVEGLELEKMRMDGHFRQTDITRQEIQDMHRAFHFVAVRWVQAMGFQGYRK